MFKQRGEEWGKEGYKYTNWEEVTEGKTNKDRECGASDNGNDLSVKQLDSVGALIIIYLSTAIK